MLGLSLSLSLMTLAGCGFGDSYKTEAAAENEVSTHSEPTEEIFSADFTDFKFQVDDVVVQTKTQMTVEEFIGQFPEGEYVVFHYNISHQNSLAVSRKKVLEASFVLMYDFFRKANMNGSF